MMLSQCTVINSLLMNHSQTDLSFSKWTRFGISVQITIFIGEQLLCSSFRHFFVKPLLLLSSCFLHHHSVMSVFIPADMLPEAGGCVPVYQSLVAFVVTAVCQNKQTSGGCELASVGVCVVSGGRNVVRLPDSAAVTSLGPAEIPGTAHTCCHGNHIWDP